MPEKLGALRLEGPCAKGPEPALESYARLEHGGRIHCSGDWVQDGEASELGRKHGAGRR